jgi:hypothetical protein
MATTGDIDAALAALTLVDKPNLSQIARDYGVNRLQLYRRHKNLCRSISEAHESQHLLSNSQQNVLIEHINRLSGLGIPPTTSMVRVFAWEISQKWPGENWVARFVLSHKDKLRSAYLSGFDLKRKKADN